MGLEDVRAVTNADEDQRGQGMERGMGTVEMRDAQGTVAVTPS